MAHSESMHTARDGAQLYWQEWLPEGTPRAVIVLIHGLGEHSGRFARRRSWTTVRPVNLAPKRSGKGTRKSFRRTTAEAIRRPSSTGCSPRRTVSTSGSSGMGLPSTCHGHFRAGCITWGVISPPKGFA